MFKNFIKYNLAKVIEINKKYSTPRIEMSQSVKFSLLTLRLYLIFLVGLLIYKFITLIT
jgi:hypothetical protein